MKISDNIATYLKAKGLSIRALEAQIGCSNGVISRCISKGTDISSQWLSKIIIANEDLNPAWLLTGEGEMTKRLVDNDYVLAEAPSSLACNINYRPNPNVASRPRLPISAAAGTLSNIAKSVTTGDCEAMPLIPSLAPYDFTICIEGDSMTPDYLSGDELACAFINDHNNIKWGKPHILDTNEGVVFKRIFDGDTSILCRSINPQKPDFEVDKDNVYRIAAVVGFIRHSL